MKAIRALKLGLLVAAGTLLHCSGSNTLKLPGNPDENPGTSAGTAGMSGAAAGFGGSAVGGNSASAGAAGTDVSGVSGAGAVAGEGGVAGQAGAEAQQGGTAGSGGAPLAFWSASDEAEHVTFESFPPKLLDGSAVTPQGDAVTEGPGVVGKGIEFNGGMLVIDRPGVDISTGDFSLLVWFKPAGDSNQVLLDKRVEQVDGVKYYTGYVLASHHSKLLFQMSSNTSSPTPYFSYHDIPKDCAFHLAAVTVTRNELIGGRLYLDGQLTRTFADLNGSLSNSSPLLVGKQCCEDKPTPPQAIDELVILKKALTEEEIGSYYRAIRAQAAAPAMSCPTATQ